MALGDFQISINLEYNMLDYAKYFLDNPINAQNKDIIQLIKFKVISAASFYELFF